MGNNGTSIEQVRMFVRPLIHQQNNYRENNKMFASSSKFSRQISRVATTVSVRGYKVCVLGASGGIGQPLSLLLKLDSQVTELSLFDVVRTPGVASDISHCSTNAKVSGHVGTDQIGAALTGSHVVVIPAGVPRKPGMTRDVSNELNFIQCVIM